MNTAIVMSGVDLLTVTPMRCTSCGNFGVACATRFCTSTCALSTSVPSLNVTVSVITPSLVACENWYSMSSTPVIACSSGPATVSAITFGFAPGYTARTTTVGGTTSGYSEIGSDGIDIKPAIRISADSTPANTGLEMKNWERFMVSPLQCNALRKT